MNITYRNGYHLWENEIITKLLLMIFEKNSTGDIKIYKIDPQGKNLRSSEKTLKITSY